MGIVYRARDPQLGRDIAIKVLPEDFSTGSERLARFENEARLASSLNHPNIVTIYSIGWQNQRRYIAMELIDGQTLQELMEKGPIPIEQALHIAVQVADGLAKAHEAGIIHRDLKPQNIMITGEGLAKILDFGLSKLTRSGVDSQALTASAVDSADSSGSLTLPGTILGTVEYMSPEQATGRPVDFRSDQFSMGSLMYAILTGTRPFHRESAVQTLTHIIEGEPRPLEEMNPLVPAAFQAVIRRCLMKNPRDRYESTRELARDLRQLELNRQILFRHWTRRDWFRAAIGLLIIVAIVGSIWIWVRRPYHPRSAAIEWYQKGLASMHSMAFESARRAFDQAVTADPRFALAQAGLARAYDEMDYSEEAKEQMLRAMAIAQETRMSGEDEERLRALQFMVSREYELAAPLLQKLEQAADTRDKPAAALERGWLAEKLDDTEGAAAAYSRALALNPGYPAAKLRLGFIRQRRGEDKLALQSFTEAEDLYRALNDSEGITETLYQRANFLNRRNRAADAMQSIDKAIAIARAIGNRYQEIRLQLLQSTVLNKLGENVHARELAQQAIDAALKERSDNLAISGMIALGNAFLSRADFESAEKQFRNALEIAQRNKIRRYEALASLCLGSLFEQKNQPEEAKQFTEAAVPLFDRAGYRRESIQSMTIIGGALRLLGSYDESVKVLREALPRAIELQDKLLELHIRQRLVETLQAQGAWPTALQEAEQAVRLSLKSALDVWAQLNCAGLYRQLGRRQDAERSLSTVENILLKDNDPQFEYMLDLRKAEIAYADGNLKQAKTFAGMALSSLNAAGDQTKQDVKLIQALASIREGQRNEGIQSALQIVQDFDKSGLAGNAAYARLAIAEALAGIREHNLARSLALDALKFFEPRKVWESAYRAHLIAARTSEGPDDILAHKNSARSALTQMRNAWPAGDVNSYLRRNDIRALSQGAPL